MLEDGSSNSMMPHRGGPILAMGILSVLIGGGCAPVGLVLSVLALKWSRLDMESMQAGEMDPQGLGLTTTGRVCAWVGLVLGILGLIWMAVVMTLMLIAMVSGWRGY